MFTVHFILVPVQIVYRIPQFNILLFCRSSNVLLLLEWLDVRLMLR